MNRKMTESKEGAESMAEAATERKEKEIGFSIREPVSGDGQMELVKFGKLKEQSYTMKESLRALKTNIQFADERRASCDKLCPAESKSTVALDWRCPNGNEVLHRY